MADLDYVKVVGRLGITRGDGPDTGDEPDTVWCDEGTVIFEPVIPEMKVVGGTQGPFTVGNAAITATVDANGWVTFNGQPFVWLLDLGSDKVNPRVAADKATYKVSFSGVKCEGAKVAFTAFSFHPLPGQDNDLTLLSPVPAAGGTPIVQGPQGVSVVDADIAAGDLLLTLDDPDSTVVNAGALPVGPGGSDAGVASYIDTPGTATRASLTAANDKRAGALNALAYAATGDGITDDTAAIQSLIDASAAQFLSSSMGESAVALLPAGKYKVSARITQPPYVKVVTLGAVVIESYVPSDSAWHIAPLASDPDNIYSVLEKQQWTKGALIDASRGGLTFVNRTGAPGATIGLELGARSDLGVSRLLARYTLNDISVQGYHHGIQWNTYGHFIAHYYRMHLGRNDIPVRVGTGIAAVNAGENINFVDSVIGTNTGAAPAFVFDAPNIDVTCRNCSLDFLGAIALFNFGWCRFAIEGGHLEGINESTRKSLDGGIAVSKVTSGTYPDVVIKGMVPLVVNERGPLFKGNLRLWLEMEYRNNNDFTNVLADENLICDDSVIVRRASLTYPTGGPLLSRKISGVPDAILAAETTGTAVASLTGWEVASVSNVTATVNASGPRAGAKSLAATITGSGYLMIRPKNNYMPCSPGDLIACTMSYNFAGTPYPSLLVKGTFYNSEKVLLTQTDLTLGRSNITPNTWRVPDGPAQFIAPPGTAYFRPSYQISSSSGDGTSVHLISDLNAVNVA